jgi:hypothetical protein
MNELLGGIEERPRDHATIADSDDEAVLAIVQRQTASVQFVVNVDSGAVIEITVYGNAQSRSDIAGSGTGAELAWTLNGFDFYFGWGGEAGEGIAKHKSQAKRWGYEIRNSNLPPQMVDRIYSFGFTSAFEFRPSDL